MKYFAYGSNMLERRLKDPARAPSASFVGIGVLPGYKLCFHKRGKDGSAKSNIVLTNDLEDKVYGVLFEINEKDFDPLDREEDILRGGYSRNMITVQHYGFIGNSTAETFLPAQNSSTKR